MYRVTSLHAYHSPLQASQDITLCKYSGMRMHTEDLLIPKSSAYFTTIARKVHDIEPADLLRVTSFVRVIFDGCLPVSFLELLLRCSPGDT